MENRNYHPSSIIVFLLIISYTGHLTAAQESSGQEVKPKTIKSFVVGTDKIVLRCDTGVIDVSFYAKDIIHFNYLPAGFEWYDFWTNKKYHGGQTITIAAPIDRIPLFVKSGSVLPLGQDINYVDEKPENLEVRIYKGSSGSCVIYQDENDNYNYEKGLFTTFAINWDNINNTLILEDQKGSFPGAPSTKTIKIVLVDENRVLTEQPVDLPDKTIEYTGREMSYKF
jgi:hypothetical protein